MSNTLIIADGNQHITLEVDDKPDKVGQLEISINTGHHEDYIYISHADQVALRDHLDKCIDQTEDRQAQTLAEADSE